MWFITVSVLTFDLVHSFLEVAKKSYQMLVMLVYIYIFIFFIFIYLGFIFISCICKYVIYVMLCMQRYSNNCMYETCTYLLIFSAKIVTANEVQ